MKRLLKNRMLASVLFSVVLTFMFVFAVAYGSTTIGTNIETAGTLTVTGAATLSSTLNVTGLTTLVKASTTMVSTLRAGYLWVGGMATTTGLTGNIDTEGNVAAKGTLTVTGTAGVTGLATLVNASTTMVSTLRAGYLWVGGMATTTGLTGNIDTEGNVTALGTLNVTGVSTLTGLAYFLGGATTTTLTLLKGEIIDNAIDGEIRTNATSSFNGYATTTSKGIIMPREVNATGVVTCSPQQDGGLIWVSTTKIFCYCDGTASTWYQATSSVGRACVY